MRDIKRGINKFQKESGFDFGWKQNDVVLANLQWILRKSGKLISLWVLSMYLINPFLAMGVFKCHQFYGSSLK
jgi:hypothetical protein